MKVIKIAREDADDVAIKLRLLAKRIESGDISYCIVYAMDYKNNIEEVVLDRLPTAPSSRGVVGKR